MLPQSFPFRLVERVEQLGEGRAAIVLPTAGGALQAAQALPVTLVGEALAQAILLLEPPPSGGVPRLVGIDHVELVRPVMAGDRLEVSASLTATFGGLRRYACRALAGGALTAVAEVTVAAGAPVEG